MYLSPPLELRLRVSGLGYGLACTRFSKSGRHGEGSERKIGQRAVTKQKSWWYQWKGLRRERGTWWDSDLAGC